MAIDAPIMATVGLLADLKAQVLAPRALNRAKSDAGMDNQYRQFHDLRGTAAIRF